MGDSLAAVLVEPMVGAGGNIPGTPGFLQGLRDASAASGAMLIFDEVMTSRLTGQGLHGHHGIRPDLVTFGKYLGGGLTFGAFGGRADILDRFDPSRADAWPHAGTFNNNVLTMTAGYTGLAEVFTPAVADDFFESGNRFRESLITALAKLDLPVSVSGLGSMMSFHFSDEAPCAPRAKTAAAEAMYELVHLDMMERGQFYARRGMINLSLATRAEQLESFVADFCEVLAHRAEDIRALARLTVR
jgi:glutamate-1-semialdehyde 2,1-aminomutase